MEQRTKTYGSMLRQWERWFHKAAYPLVFIAPNNVICLFAGAAGMSVPAFFITNVTGTIARLYLIRRLGEAFERPIDEILDFIARYRLPLLVGLDLVLRRDAWCESCARATRTSRRSRTPSTRSLSTTAD